MIIECIPAGPFATNAYVIGCLETGKAAIIDPGLGSAQEIVDIIENAHLIPEKIIITHSHWDHIGDVAELEKLWNIPIYIHPLDQDNLLHPGSDGLPLWEKIEPATPTHFLHENDTLTIGNTAWKILHTPGHSPGGICLFNENKKILISGDTLFRGTYGNLSFPTGDSKAMWNSLKKLASLPRETIVYPGHGDPTTIAEESWLPQADSSPENFFH